MFETSGAQRLPTSWRSVLAMVLAGLGGESAAQAVGERLEPDVGSWGAFAVGIAVAAVVIVIVARAASWVLAGNWRSVLGVALPVGLGFVVADQLREHGLAGFWGAALAAGLVAALVAHVATRMTHPERT